LGPLDTKLEQLKAPEIEDSSLRQMLELAERLREEHGGELDDAAILAVSEACCLPAEYVRLAVSRMPERRRLGVFHRFRNAFLALEPDDRRYVISGLISALCAVNVTLASFTGDQYGVFGTVALVMLGTGLWNVVVSPNLRTAAFAGGLFGGLFFIARSVFAMALHSTDKFSAEWLIPYVLGGTLASIVAYSLVAKNRKKLGLQDPQEERQQLLRQLVEIQDKLREGEQSMTFLSLDVVGSTKMKEVADPLNVEFTFTEYHNFVEMAARRFGGRVHSTAGDGVTCAFPHPQQAFSAARFIQAGLVELNAFRNKIGVPIRLRAGIHTGTVMAPSAQDITKISFAHVIDVAAHLQKACPPGGIAVSEDAAQKLPGGMGAIGKDCVEAQGVKGVVWQPRALEMPAAAASPPVSEAPPPLASPNPAFDVGHPE
jgi:class 3 adenylate cyclase